MGNYGSGWVSLAVLVGELAAALLCGCGCREMQRFGKERRELDAGGMAEGRKSKMGWQLRVVRVCLLWKGQVMKANRVRR